MRFKDFSGALENTLEIVKRCNLEFEFGSVQLPRFSIGAVLPCLISQGKSFRRPEAKTNT